MIGVIAFEMSEKSGRNHYRRRLSPAGLTRVNVIILGMFDRQLLGLDYAYAGPANSSSMTSNRRGDTQRQGPMDESNIGRAGLGNSVYGRAPNRDCCQKIDILCVWRCRGGHVIRPNPDRSGRARASNRHNGQRLRNIPPLQWRVRTHGRLPPMPCRLIRDIVADRFDWAPIDSGRPPNIVSGENEFCAVAFNAGSTASGWFSPLCVVAECSSDRRPSKPLDLSHHFVPQISF